MSSPLPPLARIARRIAPTALVIACLAACGGQEHVEQPLINDAAEVADAGRGLLRELRGHRRAAEVAVELDRVERWLGEADGRIADGDGDEEITLLTLQAVRGQLAAIKSYFSRREAERALDAVRGDYDLERTQLRDLESGNRAHPNDE